MGNESFGYLLRRIDLARRATTPAAWKREDEKTLMLEVAAHLREPLGLTRLEADLKSSSRLDQEALRMALGELEALAKRTPPLFKPPLEGTLTYNWRKRLTSLRGLLDRFLKPEVQEELEVRLQLELIGDRDIESLLECLPNPDPVHKRLTQVVASKLKLIPDEQVLELWRRVLVETDPARGTYLRTDVPDIPVDFFRKGDLSSLRSRYADYLVTVRPKLLRAAVQRGQTRVPVLSPGVVTVLSWVDRKRQRLWRTEDLTVVRSIGRLSLSLDDDDKKEFAGALGVVEGGYLVGGRAQREADRIQEWSKAGSEADTSWMLDELEKLVLIGQAASTTTPLAIEQALKAYKLGLEVADETLTKRLQQRGELRLQRHMVRYLVERDIFAFGTKFGWNESDAVVQERTGLVVIEAKVIPADGKKLTGRTINAWLTQLGSYLDQHRPAALGALVIYNFGEVPIFCPAIPLRHRFLLVSVNLCPDSASKREEAIHVEATKEGEALVEVFTSGGTAVGQQAKSGSNATPRFATPPPNRNARPRGVQ